MDKKEESQSPGLDTQSTPTPDKPAESGGTFSFKDIKF